MSEETTETTSGDGEKRDVGAAIKNMDSAEKMLAVGAASFLLAFIVNSAWGSLFDYQGWWMTLGFLGSIGALTLVITKLMGVKLVDAKLGAKLLLLCAAAPAVGWVIDSLKNFWMFLMMISTAVLAFAATRLIAKKD